MREFTAVEQWIDERAHRFLDRAPRHRVQAVLVEWGVFVLKQAWACLFGALLLAAILATRLWYPDDALLARNDLLTIIAVLIQAGMLIGRLETGKELRVILMFHLVGTVMELFKTQVGSWEYEGDGVLRILAVPLFSGFMYAAVGSYMARVYRMFDLRFRRYPRRWITAVIAVGIYLNFFGHHYIVDLRWVLLAAVVVAFGLCTMEFRVLRSRPTAPLLLIFAGVAIAIWVAENLATWGGAWLYPNQSDGWEPVSASKLVSWFLLMIVSVVMVAWIYPPQEPEKQAGKGVATPLRHDDPA